MGWCDDCVSTEEERPTGVVHVDGYPAQAECETAAVFNHEPSLYRCPFCASVRGEWDDCNASTDLAAQDGLAFARIAPKRWPDNPFAAAAISTAALLRDRLLSAELVAR